MQQFKATLNQTVRRYTVVNNSVVRTYGVKYAGIKWRVGGIEDAPFTNLIYVRRNGAWTNLELSQYVEKNGTDRLITLEEINLFRSKQDALGFTPEMAGVAAQLVNALGYLLSDHISDTTKHITTTERSNWNSAYNWGNHAEAGYLKSFTETDPVFMAWDKKTGILISKSQITDFPTSMPASDVYAWAKDANKPTYNYSEIGGTPTKLSQFLNDLGNYGGFVTGTPWTSAGYLTAITKAQVEAVLTGQISSHTHNYLSSFTETDPVFTAWNKSTGISITKSQISDFPTLLSQFTNNLGNYGGWITGYTETDTFASVTGRSNITATKLGVNLLYGGGLVSPTISLAIGDYDTGFNGESDGTTGYYSNGTKIYNLADVWRSNNFNPASKQDVLGYTPVNTTDSRLSDARIASDVYSWAKQASKPSYSWTEIGSHPTNLSQFVNDLGNYGSWITASALSPYQLAATAINTSNIGSQSVSYATNAGTSTYVRKDFTGANSGDLLYSLIADNDYFRLRVGGDATNQGWAEIATADDGTEPIYVRQYTGAFTNLLRTLTLLDGNGNTIVPGHIYGNANIYTNVLKTQGNQSGDYTTAPLWTQSFGGTSTGIAFHISGVVGKMLYMQTDANLYWAGNRIIDTSIIGSQSVNYATSSGSSDNTNWARYLRGAYAGGQQLNPQTYFGAGTGLKVAMTAFPQVWADTLWINGYEGSDVPDMCALHFLRNGQPRMYISTQGSTATSYGTAYELLTTYNAASQTVGYANNLVRQNMGTPDQSGLNGIFYCNGGSTPAPSGSADGTLIASSYYGGADTWGSQIYQDYRNGYMYARGRNNGSWSSWLRIIDSSNIGSQSVNYATTANKLNGSAHTNGNDGWWRSDGATGWYNETYGVGIYANDGGNVRTYNGANFISGGNIQSTGDLTVGGNVYINNNYGRTLVGTYTSDRLQGIFAMGDAYKLPADGTSGGNHYGLAWSHPNAGGQAVNLSSHGLLVMQAGTTMAAISTNIWCSGQFNGNGTGLTGTATSLAAGYVYNESANMRFHYLGQGGQPTWLWGGNSTDAYVYNPSNFSVNYANSAGSAGSANYSNFLYPVGSIASRNGYGIQSFYSWNNEGMGYCNGITMGSHPGDQSYGWQIYQRMWDNSIYFRRWDSGAYGTEYKMWTSDNFNPDYKSNAGHSHDGYAVHNTDGSVYIEGARTLYDNYRGGYRSNNDLYVAYAYNAGDAATVGGYSASTLLSNISSSTGAKLHARYIVNQTASTTLNNTNFIITINNCSAGFIVNLPPSPEQGMMIMIKIMTGSIVLAGNGKTIFSSVTHTQIGIGAAYLHVLLWDGTYWQYNKMGT
ncbi:MAG: hypothetical protein JZU53_06920 [Paludibacter sp.]|nr:hypothetical protein [Paludibacter sp.]